MLQSNKGELQQTYPKVRYYGTWPRGSIFQQLARFAPIFPPWPPSYAYARSTTSPLLQQRIPEMLLLVPPFLYTPLIPHLLPRRSPSILFFLFANLALLRRAHTHHS